MSRSIIVSTVVVGVFGAFALAAAQSGHGSHEADSSASPAHRGMQAALEESNGVLAQGLGAGLAFPADQNYYPGPLHVLELKKDVLRLTADRLLKAEARLRRLFADGIADEPRVRAATVEIERAWAEVRLVHLFAHLKTRAVLTEEQRRLYHEARWGG